MSSKNIRILRKKFLTFKKFVFINIKLIEINMNNKQTTCTLEAKDLEKIFLEIFNQFPYELCKTNSPEVFDADWDCDIAKENFYETMIHFKKNEKKTFYWNEFKEKILSLNLIIKFSANSLK
jgi:hypothetical protein